MLISHSSITDRKTFVIKIKNEKMGNIFGKVKAFEEKKLFKQEEFPQLLKDGDKNSGFFVNYPEDNKSLIAVRSKFNNLSTQLF